MSGNGARGTRRGNGGGRGRGKGTMRRERKELGKAALTSILKNDATINSYLETLEEGKDPGAFSIAKVISFKAVNNIVVQIKGQPETRASLEGLYRGRGNFWKNPEVSTAVRVGGYVLVEDIGLGYMARGAHHRIVGIFDSEQARHAKRLLNQLTENAEEANMFGFVFDREEADERIRTARAANISAAARELASMRRGRTGAAAATRRSSSGKMASSGASTVSSNINWAALSEEKKTAAKAAKLSRRKARAKEKKAAAKAAAGGGGGSAWSWFSF